MEAKSTFVGLWMPAEILSIEVLSPLDKIILIEIFNLDRQSSCYATNSHFSEKLKVSDKTVSRSIQSLIDFKYISAKYERHQYGTKRFLSVTNKTRVRMGQTGNFAWDKSESADEAECPPKVTDIKITNTNTQKENNTSAKANDVSSSSLDGRQTINKKVVPSEECIIIIDYLNKVAEKNYSADTSITMKLISGRLKQGYKLNDFFRVIDSKTKQWKGKEQEMYLRPSTLFNEEKFEAYFNQLPPAEKEENIMTCRFYKLPEKFFQEHFGMSRKDLTERCYYEEIGSIQDVSEKKLKELGRTDFTNWF